MTVFVLYFGVLKDLVGTDRASLTVSEGSSVGGLIETLQAGESPVWKTLAVAVNREYASRDTVLREGDEVALLPPVSGGGW